MPAKKTTPRRPARTTMIDETADSVAKRTFIALSVILGFGLLLMFLFAIRDILLLLVIATTFALALGPAVNWFVGRGMPRVAASLSTVIVTLVLVLGVGAAAASPLVSETSTLINNAPQIIDDIAKSDTVKKLDREYHIIDRAKEAVNDAPNFLGQNRSSIVETARSTFGAIANVLIIIVLTFFLLLEGPTSWKTVTSLLNPRYAKRVDRTGEKIAKGVGGYVTGNLFISLIAGTVAYVTLVILNVPYAFPLAVLVAIFDLIPLVGAVIAMIIVALVALSQSVLAALVVIGVITIYQQIEGNAIQPVVYSRTVELSPLVILVATLIGATLGGVVGVLLAIPAAATVQTVILELLSGTASGRRARLA